MITGAAAGQTPQATVGVLSLHYETVQRALTEQALALLLPPSLHISFSPQQSFRSAQQDAGHAPQHDRYQGPLQAQHGLSMQSMAPPAPQDAQAAQDAHTPGSSSLPEQQQQRQEQQAQQWQERDLQHQQPQHQQPQQMPPQRQSSQLLRLPSHCSLGVTKDGVQYRLLRGTLDGTGMNSSRGSLWTVVVPVGQLIPLTLLVGNSSFGLDLPTACIYLLVSLVADVAYCHCCCAQQWHALLYVDLTPKSWSLC